MRKEISRKLSFLIIGIGGIAFFAVVIFFLTLGLFGQDSYAKQIEPTDGRTQNSTDAMPTEQTGIELPIRLRIPKINVSADVISVGTTPEGAMDVPKDPSAVAWFKFGPRPGGVGSAVISGHYGWKGGISAVFDNLHKLRKGNKLYIEDEKGVITTFVVRELRRYDKDEDATDVFISSDGKAHLNLITCEGVWNKASKSYSKRLVVFTDRVDEVNSTQ